MSRFLFGRYVEGDLREIRDTIAQGSPGAALRLMVRFVGAFRLLANRPELGHVREDLPVPSLRFWAVGSYLVVYRAEKPSGIVAIVHGARDVPSVVNRRL